LLKVLRGAGTDASILKKGDVVEDRACGKISPIDRAALPVDNTERRLGAVTRLQFRRRRCTRLDRDGLRGSVAGAA